MATSRKTKQPKSRAKPSGKRATTKPRKSPPKASSKEAKAGLRMPTPKKRAPSTKVHAKKPESKTGRRRDAPMYVMTTKQIENFLHRLAVDDTYWEALLNDPRGTCLAVGIALPDDFELPVDPPSREQILELLSTVAGRLHEFGCFFWQFHLLFDPYSGVLDPP